MTKVRKTYTPAFKLEMMYAEKNGEKYLVN